MINVCGGDRCVLIRIEHDWAKGGTNTKTKQKSFEVVATGPKATGNSKLNYRSEKDDVVNQR